MKHYDVITLQPGQCYRFDRKGEKEKMIVGKGSCIVAYGARIEEAMTGSNLDLSDASDFFEITEVKDETVLIRMCGSWGEETGNSGLFQVQRSENPKDKGDREDYPKETNFDSHYHDCDEYWIVFEGEGTVVSEKISYTIDPGDCLATGQGHHHDFPLVVKPVKAVYFETTLTGQKRLGHLWDYQHGKAEPDYTKC